MHRPARGAVRPEDLLIGLAWMGPGRGSRMRLQHVPTGIVLYEPLPADADRARARAELFERMRRELAERGAADPG